MEKGKDKVLFMNSKKYELKIFYELQEYVKVIYSLKVVILSFSRRSYKSTFDVT